MTDRELIGQYVEAASQQAFGELVRRHAGWVYGCARRKVRDAHSAEDVTQAVFILLSQNARKVGGNERLAPWLFKATHYCSANALKQHARRQKHEREAAMQQQMAAGDAAANWEEIWPILDEAVRKLRSADREAVLLRFYQGMSVSELAGAIGTGEDAAKKRVQRAVEKLRGVLAKKGVMPGVGALSVVMAEKLAEAAPAGLVEAATAAGVGGGAGSAGVIAKGAIKMMAWAKVKVAAAILLGVGAVSGAGMSYVMMAEHTTDTALVAQTQTPVVAMAEAQTPAAPNANRLDFRMAVSREGNEPTVAKNEANRLLRELAQQGPGAIKQQRAAMGWCPLDDNAAKAAPGMPIAGQWNGRWYLLASTDPKHSMPADEAGKRAWGLTQAYVAKDQMGQPAVGFDFDQAGAERFRALTGAHIGGRLAVLVDGQVVNVATINSVISSSGIITSQEMTGKDVSDLAARLQRGMPAVSGPVSQPSVSNPRGWEGFDAEVEIVVPAALGNPKTGVLRLADGKLVVPPPEGAKQPFGAEWNDWAERSGVDLMAANDAMFQGLMGFDMAAVPIGRNLPAGVGWASSLRALQRTLKPGSPALMSAAGTLPVHYGIQTRSGAMGVLSILELTDNPKGVKIRYRLLSDKAASRPVISTTRPGNGKANGT